MGLARSVQLFVVLAVSIPGALLGLRLGMSSPVNGDLPRAEALPAKGTVPAGPPGFALPETSAASATPPSTSAAPATNPGVAPVNVDAASRPLTPLLVDNFDGNPVWPSSNDLAQPTSASGFANGGHGVVAAGNLTLVYSKTGVFDTAVSSNISNYTYLVMRITGTVGGEERDFTIALGGIQRLFGDFVLDGGGRPVVNTSYREIRIPMAANGIDKSNPGRLELNFAWGNSGTVVIDEIDFEGPDSATIDDAVVGTGLNHVSYAGYWGNTTTTFDDGRYAGSNHYTDSAGSTATLTFIGNRVTLYTELASWGGYASVIVDGGARSTVDFYDADWVPDYPVWDSGPLAYGQHTVVLRLLGTSRPAASGVWVDIDRFDLS